MRFGGTPRRLGGATLPTPQILLDCDVDSDIDDVFDIITLLNLERRGECQIVGMNVSSTNTDEAGCLYAFLNYYGRTTIPVGYSSAAGSSGSVYTAQVNSLYGVAGHKLSTDFPSTTTIYRRILAAAAANSIIILTTGSLSSVVTLLQSPADSISSLTGLQLVTAKVKAIYVTAGYWPSGAAVSDFGGSPSAITASSTFLSTWPASVPVIFNGIENGDTWSSGADGSALHLDANNPARYAMTLYLGALTSASSRNAWSPTAILAAVRGQYPYVYEADRGTGSIDGGTGATTWTSSASGPHRYLRKLYTDTQLTDLVNSILSVDPITWPALTSLTDVDALALFARMKNYLYTDAKQLIHDFIVGLKADGDWTKLSRLHVFAVGGVEDAVLDWKGGTSATFSGTYTHKPYHGIHGDGVTGKIDFNFNPASDPALLFARDSNHIAIYPASVRA
jgi:hypothetical protein